MIPAGLIRVKYVLLEHGRLLAILCALIGIALLGGAGWLYTHPPTTQVTDHTDQRTVRSELSTLAVVTNDTTLYEQGTQLRNEPVYLNDAAPTVTLTQETNVSPSRPVEVQHELTLVYSATRNGETFWTDAVVLERHEEQSRSGAVTTDTNVSIPEVRNRVRHLREEIGDAGTIGIDLRISVSYELPGYEGTLTESVPIRTTDTWYAVTLDSMERTHSTRQTRVVSVPNPYPVSGLGVLGGLFVLSGGGIAAIYYTGNGRRDREETEFRIHRIRYAEWISRGSISDEIGRDSVSMATLEDLVDVAIDTGNRVIYDPDREVYAVIDESTTYYFDRFWSEFALTDETGEDTL